MMTVLTAETARDVVESYMRNEGTPVSTQEILDSGAIPRLQGYHVRPGKVSDSIFGGPFSYETKDNRTIEGENPPLMTKNGIPLRIMVRTERISTHDINRGSIPFKDQILAANHHYMLRLLRPFLGTSQLDTGQGDNAVVITAEDLHQIPFENVLRAYMAKSSTATSLYQHVMAGKRTFCGHNLPENLFANGPLPYVMDTPSTKSDKHDESLAPEELFNRGVCTPEQYAQIRNSSLVAFGMVTRFLEEKGIIAVDTKTEHGINHQGKIVIQDELWTMDSSRFWLREDYEEQISRFKAGEIAEINPKSFSKEFARGFSEGEKGYTDDQRAQIAVRYIEGIQHLLGMPFQPDLRPWEERVTSGLENVIKNLL